MLGKVNSLHGWYYWRAGIRNSIMLSLCFRSIAGTVLRPSSTHQEDDCKWLHAFSGKDQEKNEFMDWSFPLTRWSASTDQLSHYESCKLWLAAFRLPSSCLKEIERLCAAFLWSGPDLKTTKAKVSWQDICLPRNEGGLGIRPLKEVNNVHCLKLIWRIASSCSSLWVKWIHCYLIRKGSFWSISVNTNLGSWMWKKLLKMRSIAR